MASNRRGGGVSGYLVGMVVFAALFVICLISAILFYTWSRSANIQAEQARADREKLLKSTERGQSDYDTLLNTPGPDSVVTRLFKENRDFKILAVGDVRETLENIKKQKELAGIAAGQSLLGEVYRLAQEKTAANEAAAKALADRDEMFKKLALLQEEKKAGDEKLFAMQKQLSSQFESLKTTQKAFETTSGSERKKLEQRLADLQGRLTKDVNEANTIAEQMKQENRVLRDRLSRYERSRSKTVEGPDPTTVADGKIIGIAPDNRTVYINLGKSQRVVLGLPFNVYSLTDKIEKDSAGELKPGKAIIEVISISDTTAAARIIQMDSNITLTEGDLIANAVYDPNYSYKFYVFGDFDLDAAGNPSSADRKRIEAMVMQWGGQLVDRLSYDTDFLVLGVEPKSPDPLPRDVRDPAVIEEHARRQKIWEEYQKLLADSGRYSIKVLNTNRFLSLVGYYQR